MEKLLMLRTSAKDMKNEDKLKEIKLFFKLLPKLSEWLSDK